MGPMSPNISKYVLGVGDVGWLRGDEYKTSQLASRLSAPALLKEEHFSFYLYYILA